MTDSDAGSHRQILQRIAHRATKIPTGKKNSSFLPPITPKEPDAEKVERLVRKSAAALLLECKVGQRFEAVFTGASKKGTWVRLLPLTVE